VKFNKLVRDEIPRIIEDTGKWCRYHIAGLDEYETHLYKKMGEELDEFIETPSYEEAADMWEVFKAICEFHRLDINHVKSEALKKKMKRGAFKERIILDEVNESR
tara:strand:+ start:13092 stop:13406 length:315 start_codon:yes stop_codon:yes gene_type:complete